MKFIVGIDVGGTNTDFVVIDENKKIFFSKKQLTSKLISDGIIDFFQNEILKNFKKEDIKYISLGTTFALNSILESKNLSKVGSLRIAGHFPDSLDPLFEWDEEIKNKILIGFETSFGGYECDGIEINKINFNDIEKKIKILIGKGAEEIAISGVFSLLYSNQEKEVEKFIIEKFNIPVTISSEISEENIIDRENATILNCGIKKSFFNEFSKLNDYFKCLNLKFFIVKNNGTLENFDYIAKYPIKTLAAGITNSSIGGSKIANLKDAIIIDIGGTSTDFCFIENGFPIKSKMDFKAGGINLQIEAPKIFSIGLGGGSLIKINEKNEIEVGPKSIAKNLFKESFAFGGNEITLTDAAISANVINFENSKKYFNKLEADKILDFSFQKITDLLNKILSFSKKEYKVIFVGGGSILFKNQIEKNKNFLIPENFEIANAYGAACAEFSITIQTIDEYDEKNIQKICDNLKNEMIQKGIKNNIRIIEKIITPFYYMNTKNGKIKITIAGER